MKASEVRRKFLDYFVKLGHVELPSARLVPENDPTTLFTSSGMQPLVPYLLGEPHPAGKRVVNSQKCFRAQDIDEVGDNRHTTFFEMLGNWSFGDYFKKEQLPWIFGYLTRDLGLDPKRLYVTVFEGNASVPKDTESIKIWKDIFSGVGIGAREGKRIFAYPAKKNWWSRAGEPDNMPPGEPGGPDSEVFYDFGEDLMLHEHSAWKNENCHPNCDCGRFMEIANSVFMQYKKLENGGLVELAHKNVDFGGGLERLVAATENVQDVFETDLFMPIIKTLESLSRKNYLSDKRSMRIVADHIKAAVMMMADGVIASNKTQGYIQRRLIRRAILYGRRLGLSNEWKHAESLVYPIVEIYKDTYPEVLERREAIVSLLVEEAQRFGKTLEKGLNEIYKINKLDGYSAFKIYETYGFPWEMTEEIARERGQIVAKGDFERAYREHQDASRTAAKGMFKGGLQDHSEQVIKLHTATHLLHEALRRVLGLHVKQKGSNITSERLRFDFSHSGGVSQEEIVSIEKMVNEQIALNKKVSYEIIKYDDAIREGALAFFGERYPEQVKVYTIEGFSKEICGGPHVERTGVLGKFSIIRQEALGSGTRRIYAKLTSS